MEMVMALPIRTVTRPSVLAGRTNGELPDSILVDTPGLAGGVSVRLVLPAARGWRALTAAALKAGHTLKATSRYDSYRPYAIQERTFRQRYTTEFLEGRPYRVWQAERWYQRPGTAPSAVPGTSNHGWGLAVDCGEERDGDTGVESIDAATVAWLAEHEEAFGYSHELQIEPWHVRWWPGNAIPEAVIAYEEDDMFDQATWNKITHEEMLGSSGPTYAVAWQGTYRASVALLAAAAEDATRDAAALAAVNALADALRAGGGSVDAAMILTVIREEAARSRALVEELQATVTEQAGELERLRARLARAAQAGADALASDGQ